MAEKNSHLERVIWKDFDLCFWDNFYIKHCDKSLYKMFETFGAPKRDDCMKCGGYDKRCIHYQR